MAAPPPRPPPPPPFWSDTGRDTNATSNGSSTPSSYAEGAAAVATAIARSGVTAQEAMNNFSAAARLLNPGGVPQWETMDLPRRPPSTQEAFEDVAVAFESLGREVVLAFTTGWPDSFAGWCSAPGFTLAWIFSLGRVGRLPNQW